MSGHGIRVGRDHHTRRLGAVLHARELGQRVALAREHLDALGEAKAVPRIPIDDQLRGPSRTSVFSRRVLSSELDETAHPALDLAEGCAAHGHAPIELHEHGEC